MKDKIFNFIGFGAAGTNFILGFTVNEIAALVTFLITLVFFLYKGAREKVLTRTAKLAEEEAKLNLKIRQYEYNKKLKEGVGETDRHPSEEI